eukprot:2735015-Rhodomonas_salina.1
MVVWLQHLLSGSWTVLRAFHGRRPRVFQAQPPVCSATVLRNSTVTARGCEDPFFASKVWPRVSHSTPFLLAEKIPLDQTRT